MFGYYSSVSCCGDAFAFFGMLKIMLDFFAAIRDVFVQHEFFVGNEHGMKIGQIVAELE